MVRNFSDIAGMCWQLFAMLVFTGASWCEELRYVCVPTTLLRCLGVH